MRLPCSCSVLAFRRTYGVRQEAQAYRPAAAGLYAQAGMPTLPFRKMVKEKKGSLKYRSASIVQDTSNEREHRRFPIQTRSSCLRTPRTVSYCPTNRAATRRVRNLESGWLVSKQAKSSLHPSSRLTPPQRSWERHPQPNTAAVGAGRLGVVENLFLRQECLPYLLKRKKREPRLDEAPL